MEGRAPAAADLKEASLTAAEPHYPHATTGTTTPRRALKLTALTMKPAARLAGAEIATAAAGAAGATGRAAVVR